MSGDPRVTAETEPQVRPSPPVLAGPLLGGNGQKVGWLVAACCAVIVAALPLLFGHRDLPDWLDRNVDHAVKAMYGTGHYSLLTWLAYPGTLLPVAAVIAVIVVACLFARRLGGAALAIIAVPVAVELTERVLKPLVNRASLGFTSYPSGHAVSTFAIASVLAVLLFGPTGKAVPRALRLIITLAAIGVSCVVSTAVIALSWHYFTDTVGGIATAVGVVLVTALLLDRPVLRRLLAAADRWLADHFSTRYLRRGR
jgi:membrane-associated phospholipid phosphatase